MNFDETPLWQPGTAPSPEFCSEDKCLAVLASFDADELSGDEELARITRFAAQLCGSDIAAVTLVEAERQYFVAGTGLPLDETPRHTSFCAHTMLGHDLLEVMDPANDPRFTEFDVVTGPPGLRYYAGAPLISPEGAPLGALCVLDTKSHDTPLTAFQREGLTVLAEAVMRRLHFHRTANAAGIELLEGVERLQFVLDSVPDIAWSATAKVEFDYFNARFTEITGLSARRTVEDWREAIHPEDFDATRAKVKIATSTATSFDDEWRLRQADGSYRWALSRAVPSNDNPKTARWFGTITDVHDRHQLFEERELLAGELAHRIKNIFSVITGLVTLHARGEPGLKQFTETLTDHIRALSRAQDFALKVDAKADDNLKGLLGVLMAPYGVPGHSQVKIDGGNIATGARAATPLALVFHELATNSAKYGALSVSEGNLAIDITQAGENVKIVWGESGGPLASPPEESGFGSRLVKMAIENQLGGTIAQDWRETGLMVVITIPATRLQL